MYCHMLLLLSVICYLCLVYRILKILFKRQSLEKYLLTQKEGVQTAPYEPLQGKEMTVLGDIIKYVKRKIAISLGRQLPSIKIWLVLSLTL